MTPSKRPSDAEQVAPQEVPTEITADIWRAFEAGFLEPAPESLPDAWLQVLMDHHLPVTWIAQSGGRWFVNISTAYLDQLFPADARRHRKRIARQIEQLQRQGAGVQFTEANRGFYRVQVIGPMSREQAREFSIALLKLEATS